MMAPDPSENDRKAALRSQIDENLRRIYHTAVEDAVPERFTRLLQQLRDSAGASPQGPGAVPDPSASVTETGT